MIRSECMRKINGIRQNHNRGEYGGFFINKIYFPFIEWDIEPLRDGVLVRTNGDGFIGYTSLYIPFCDIIEIK